MTAKRVSKKTTKQKAAAPARKKTAKKTAKVSAAKTPRKKAAAAKPAKKKSPAKSKTVTSRSAKAKPKTVKKKALRRPAIDLDSFREGLRLKQQELLQAYLNAKGDSRNRESDGTEDYIDYAVSSYDREFLLSLTELERDQLNLVEEALTRIEEGQFGLCVQCERPIRPKRLEVQPWARYCLRCQELADTGYGQDSFEFPTDDDGIAISDDEDLESEEGGSEDVAGEELIGA